MMSDLLLYNKHYSYIQSNGIKIVALHPINYQTVIEQNDINSDGIIIDK